MSTKSSTATIMAWNWIIQSLAKFKQVDVAILAGLVKKSPAISDDLGTDAREVVSLRILESLFIHENEATVDTESSRNAKISFDPSEHCEDVLHKILEETSERITELERKKWNVRPFILHKRDSLPKSPLQKFKEALFKSSHPILESLKETSKLGSPHSSENTIPEINAAFNPQTNETNNLEENMLPKSDHIGTKEREMTKEPLEKILEEHVSNSERSDSDQSDNEQTDIAAKKEAFLSSQCTLSQDFVATIDCTEIFNCMKCNNSGQLLVCNSDACPFKIHESCLGSAVIFDENGIFFCPFCAYSHAISKYTEIKKKASLARKDLQLFLSSGVERRPDISSRKGDCLGQNESGKIGDVGEKVKVNEERHDVNRGKEDCAPGDPTDSVHQAVLKRNRPKQQYDEKESYEPSVSSHSKRPRKRGPQYTSPAITLARRKNLPWTKSEEEILKEGIRRFSSGNDKGLIPWKDILEFGRDIFNKSRTTIDLKDKWRNISKERPDTKKIKL